MNKRDHFTRTFLGTAVALAQCAAIAQTWTALDPLPAPARDAAICFAIDDQVYLGGGFGRKDFFQYDPGTQHWTAKPGIPGVSTERAFATGFAVNGKGYVCLGSDGTTFKQDLWEYDPTLNTWTQKASYPSAARNTAFGFGLGNYGYVCGGADNDYIYSDFYRYDPATDEWTLLGPLPSGPTAFGSTFVIGDHAYLMGGDHGTGETAEVYRFDPTTEEWTPRADFTGAPRQTGVAFALNGKGYFGAGQSAYTTAYDDMFSYDPAADSWSPAGTFNGGVRCWAAACNTADKAFMGTGWDFGANFFNDWWSFNAAVGMDETLVREQVSLFPVPATDVLNIRFGSISGALVITDALGRVVNSGRVVNGRAEVDVSALSAGSYQVMITERNGRRVRSAFTRD